MKHISTSTGNRITNKILISFIESRIESIHTKQLVGFHGTNNMLNFIRRISSHQINIHLRRDKMRKSENYRINITNPNKKKILKVRHHHPNPKSKIAILRRRLLKLQFYSSYAKQLLLGEKSEYCDRINQLELLSMLLPIKIMKQQELIKTVFCNHKNINISRHTR